MNPDIAVKEALEIVHYRDSEYVRPGADHVLNLITKLSEARTLARKLLEYSSYFSASQAVLELGAGQGWGTCVAKKLFPTASFTTSDISPYALESLPMWERVFGTKVDRAVPCRSYEIPLPDGSLDLVFAFASAHHFARHDRTLLEIARVLRPGGAALYLYEPTSPRFLYPLAKWRANRKRPEVPEDVLIPSDVLRLARQSGFEAEVRYDRSPEYRGVLEQNYYLAQKSLPFLSYLLPCTADFIFRKPKEIA